MFELFLMILCYHQGKKLESDFAASYPLHQFKVSQQWIVSWYSLCRNEPCQIVAYVLFPKEIFMWL